MIRKNIFANIIGRGSGFISVYLFVPLYLKFLGIEAYGLIGFYSALLGVLIIADMGFTATLNREMARLSCHNDSGEEMRDLLTTYELAYLCITSILAILIWMLAPLIVAHWLRPSLLHPQEVTLAIRLMGIAIAFQLPAGLYIGGLMGLQQQLQANLLQIAWSLYRGLGGVLVLWLLSPTIVAFAFWQLASNAVYCFTARRSLWRALLSSLPQTPGRFKLQVFRNTWRYGAGMIGMATLSTLLTQTDKLAVSKLLPLDMLGSYTLAGSLAAVPVILASPIASAVFPRLTQLVMAGDRVLLVQLYHRASNLAAVAIIPAGLTMAFFAGDFIRAWTGLPVTAQRSELVAAFLIGGQSMQAITLIPFYVALAHGDVKLNLQIGIVSVLMITPLLIYLILQFGIDGAGLSWLIMNLCTLPPYMYYLHRRFLPGEFGQWCWQSLGRPLLTALPCVLVGRWLTPHSDSRVLMFVFIGLVFSVTFILSAVAVRELRDTFIKKVRKFHCSLYAP